MRSKNAIRLKKRRERAALGRNVLHVEVETNTLAEYLLRRKAITVEQSEDLGALADVLAKWVATLTASPCDTRVYPHTS